MLIFFWMPLCQLSRYLPKVSKVLLSVHATLKRSQPRKDQASNWLSDFGFRSLDFAAEAWSTFDDNVGKRLGLWNVDDLLLLQHQQCMELCSGVLAGHMAGRNNRREFGLAAAGTTECALHYLVHFGCICEATSLKQIRFVQFLQLKHTIFSHHTLLLQHL